MSKVGNYLHVDEARLDLTEIQLQVMADLQRSYPPSMFKTTATDYRVKNTLNIHCKNCDSDNVYVVSKQLRSADEATTKIYTCLNGGNVWRVG